MLNSSPLHVFGREISVLIAIFALLAQLSGCSSGEGESDMNSTHTANIDSAVIRVIGLSGKVSFADSPIAKGASLHGAGLLKAEGESSWVDLEYLGGERLRLKNASAQLSFGDQLNSNTGLDLGDGATGTNTRVIHLKSGKLFVSIAKFEQLRKVQYYFSTDLAYLNVTHATFLLEADNHRSKISLCEGSLSVAPSYAIEKSTRPTWPEVNLSRGNTLSVNLTEVPKPTALAVPEKAAIASEFRAMGITACSAL